jgi:hypothetical protein
MKTTLDWALRYAAIVWPVVPQKRDKLPLVASNAHAATTDPKAIARWWYEHPTANIAVACRDLLVLDVDARHGGLARLAELESHHGELPETPRARSGGGGLHIVFQRPPFECVGALKGGIEVKTGHQLFTVEPSIHVSGRRYRWQVPPSVPLAEIPPWLAALVRRPLPEPESSQNTQTNGTRESRMERARRYASKAEPAIAGCRGAFTTMRVCGAIRRLFHLDVDDAFEVLSSWNLSCDPPWSERELRRKLRDAKPA